MSNETIDGFYKDSFIPRAHRIGRLTLLSAMILCLLPALYLSFWLDSFPGIGAIVTGFISVAAFVGIVWVIEPISYFPVLGVAGTYMSFLSGNIGNMRMPVVISCQNTIEAETGSHKAEVVAVIGIAVSVLVNLVFLIALILIGSALIDVMPAAMATAVKNYTLPALYGAVVVMFISPATRYNAITGLLVGLATLLAPIPEVYGSAGAGLLAIVTCFALNHYRRRKLAA